MGGLKMLQLALAVIGLIVLFTGKLKLSADKVVEGTPARLLALILLTPLPLGFMVGLGVGVWAATAGKPIDDIRMPLLMVDVGLTIAAAVVTFGIASVIARPPGQQKAAPQWPETTQWPQSFPSTPPPPSDPNNPYQSPHV
jgi:hypothetical protein